MGTAVKTNSKQPISQPKNKGGAPKKRVRRELIVRIRMTATERFQIDAKAKAAGMRPSTWIRAAAKNARIVPRLTADERRILWMLAELANNLNQLTKLAHQQRKSSISYSLNEKKIIITNGKRTGKLGVIKNYNDHQHFHYTDVERTLIDCAVRPVYAGGVFEVLEAFKLGMEQLDVKKMASYLDQIDYIYPYDQVIGFYLEKAGYDESTLNIGVNPRFANRELRLS